MRPSDCHMSNYIGTIVALHGIESWKEDNAQLDDLVCMLRQVKYVLSRGLSWITEEEDIELAEITMDVSKHILSLKGNASE